MSYTIEDPFRSLGPIAIFSAHRHWTAPRNIHLKKHSSKNHSHSNRRRHSSHFESSSEEVALDSNTIHDVEGYGFHLHGAAPVMVSHIYINSLADVKRRKIILIKKKIFNFLIIYINAFLLYTDFKI